MANAESTTTFGQLPASVIEAIQASWIVEFATMTATGVPIDTPVLGFADLSGGTVDVTTGLAYPAKAERARRDPRVGLLFENADDPDSTIVSMSAHAAVRDADIQANAERYLRHSTRTLQMMSSGYTADEVRAAVWYWCRIWVECTPVRIRWWSNTRATDEAPREWRAPPSVALPLSDPSPSGAPSRPSSWAISDWRARAEELVSDSSFPHLTLVDQDGYPLPFPTNGATQTAEGFSLDVPAGHPWPRLGGKASLRFGRGGCFVGNVVERDDAVTFVVTRLLPDLPLVRDQHVFAPNEATRLALTERLEHELARRGQPMPTIPPPPEP